jgi:hypothetical protein
MHQFKDNKSGVYYHEQKFTLQWNFPDARWVIVKYFNGNKRVILPIVTNSKNQTIDGSRFKFLNFVLTRLKPLRLGKTITWTEFKYKVQKKAEVSTYSQKPIPAHFGFKRIFFLKSSDEFSNIANFQSQWVQLFVVTNSFPWVKSIKIPLHVKLLRIVESKINVNLTSINIEKEEFHVIRQAVNIMRPDISIENTNLTIQMPDVHPQIEGEFSGPQLSTSIATLIATEKISERTNNESILQLIN